MPIAEKEFSNFVEKSGYKYGVKSVKEATGKMMLSDDLADNFISDTMEKIGRLEGTTTGDATGTALIALPENTTALKQATQQALAARYATKDAISRAMRSGNKEKAKLFIEGRSQIDDWLEKQIPGFEKVRTMYSEAKAAEVFKPFLPTNDNGKVSALRSMAIFGTFLTDPIMGMSSLAVASPRVAGLGLKGIALANTVKQPLGAIASQGIAGAINESQK
jgi:hypothetical protein